MKYYVIENRNTGLHEMPRFAEIVLFSGTEKECAEFEAEKRKEYTDRTIVDCYTISEQKFEEAKKFNEFWDSLTPAEKKETIEVNGKTYFKKAYEYHNK
jgi:hypothetical protein